MHYFLSLFMLAILFSSPSYSQQNDEHELRLSEIKEQFQIIQKELLEHDSETTRKLGLGLPNKALSTDLKQIVENVLSLQTQLNDLKQELKEIAKESDDSALAISKIWVTNEAKSDEEFKQIPEDNSAYLYVSFSMPKKMDLLQLNLTVVDKKTGQEIVNIDRERERKGEDIKQKTGLALKSEQLTLGVTYEFTATLIDSEDKTINQTTSFQYGQAETELSALTLTVSDENGELAGSNVSSKTKLRFVATVPLASEGQGTITWSLLDSDGQLIPNSEKEEVIDENGEEFSSRYGFKTKILAVDSYTVVVSHQLEGQEKNIVTAQFPFSIAGSFAVHSLTVSNSNKGNLKDGVLKEGERPHLSINYTANGAVRTGMMRVYDATTNVDYYNKDVTERVKVDGKKHRIGVKLKEGLIPLGKAVIFEATFTDQQGNELNYERTFSFVEKANKTKKADNKKNSKEKFVNIEKNIHVSGSVSTPGSGSYTLDLKNKNNLKTNSKVTLSVSIDYPTGGEKVDAWLILEVNRDTVKRIRLDGSQPNLDFSFSPSEVNTSGSFLVTLDYRAIKPRKGRPRQVYAAKLNVDTPFSVSFKGSDSNRLCVNDKGEKLSNSKKCRKVERWEAYSWLRDEIGVVIRAKKFDVKTTLTVKSTLDETGEVLFNYSDTVNLSAETKFEKYWKLDQKALRFDFENKFPNIPDSDDWKKTISTEVIVKNDEGYEWKREFITTQRAFILNLTNHKGKYLREGSNTNENPLNTTFIPPAIMKGPFRTTIQGVSFYYMNGLDWYYDPDKFESWVASSGARQYKETEERVHYKKDVPLLITIEDSTGKQAFALWENHPVTVGLARSKEESNLE